MERPSVTPGTGRGREDAYLHLLKEGHAPKDPIAMTKLYALIAASAVFAPIAFAVLSQAVQIVA
jgi:hypothetical protein